MSDENIQESEKTYSTVEKMRHSTAHVLAMAVLEMFPTAKLGIGPVIEDGFYYDFRLPRPLEKKELADLEKRMKRIIKQDLPFTHTHIARDQAEALLKEQDQPLKQDILADLPDTQVSFYKTGDNFIDLCRGPHVESTRKIAAFKLLKTAGAYWRGDESNEMLTRIYGTTWESKEELATYLHKLEEAKKRDHKKLGKQLDLFIFSDLVGGGLPLWTPKGTILRNELDAYVWQLRQQKGYERVEIPHITKKDLFIKSGHWDKFKEELFRITTREGHEFAMKPMNCPLHTQIYARTQQSYRNLPTRYANTTMCYRDEQTGELSGLSRVRAFTQDDAHVFCRTSDVEQEANNIWDIIETFYATFGMTNLVPRLSLHDPAQPKKYLGDETMWQKSEETLRSLMKKRLRGPFEESLGEAAFYGPKIDFMAKDALGREWQVATIQLDVNMPERFDLTCINEKGEKERIVMIHAAIMGSIERFLSTIIEHFAGAFPTWLSPIQVGILPVSDTHNDFAYALRDELMTHNIRAHVDDDTQSVGKKIREAEVQKYPYMLVVGEKEKESGKLMIRKHGQKDQQHITKEEFIAHIINEINTRSLS
jgi:threonyl-tRNA synthetase